MTAAVSASALALIGCEAGGNGAGARTGDTSDEVGAPGGAPEDGLHIASDRAFIFEEPGERAQLDVEVHRKGAAVPAPDVRFSSSDPAVVSVDQSGLLVAHADLGSAVITVDAAAAEPELVHAVVADLAPRAHRIERRELIEIDDELSIATIQVSAGASPFEVGDILISGERDGLFARVTEVWDQGDGTYEVAFASDVAVTEAFDNLDLRAHTPPLAYEAGQTAALLDGLTCVDESNALVEFSGPEIEPILDAELHFDYVIESGDVARAEVYLEGDLGFEAHTGEVRLEGDFGGEFRCHVALPDIGIPEIPVLGPVIGVGGTISSRVGVQGSARFEDASLTYAGPTVAQELEAKLGLRASPDEGLGAIRGVEVVRDEVTHGELENRLHDGELGLGLSPFVEADLSVRIGVGPIGVDIDLVTATAAGGLEFSLAPPLDPYAAGYTGPRWALFVEGAADLHPRFDLDALLDVLERWLGLELPTAAAEFEPAFWDARRDLATSPRPEVITDREHVALGEDVEIAATELADYEGSVEYLLHHCGEGLGESLADASTGESVAFTPLTEEDRGTHELGVLLWDGRFGDLGLPYAAARPGTLRVGDDPGEICSAGSP